MSYVDLVETPHFLSIRLLPAGREELLDQRLEDGNGWKHGTVYVFMNLIEDWLCNGWQWVEPETIGALTAAPILRSPMGKLYWFPDYAITCELEEILAKGEVLFRLVEE